MPPSISAHPLSLEQKKQSSVKSRETCKSWTRKDVFLDMLEQRGISFQEMLENAAFFRANPYLLPTMLKILNHSYDLDGWLKAQGCYGSNEYLAKYHQTIGSVFVKACSQRTIKRHKAQLQAGKQLTLVERHSFKKREKTLRGVDLVGKRPRTTLCIPSEYYVHFNSAVDWHKTTREFSELFSEQVSDLISYEQYEEINLCDINSNNSNYLNFGLRYTITTSCSSKEEGTLPGPIFFKAQTKENGELRKPRESSLLFTAVRQGSLGNQQVCDGNGPDFVGSPARQSSLVGSNVVKNAQEERDFRESTACSNRPDVKINEKPHRRPPDGLNAKGVGLHAHKEKQASTGSLNKFYRKQDSEPCSKSAKLVRKPLSASCLAKMPTGLSQDLSELTNKKLKFNQMPDIRWLTSQKAREWGKRDDFTEAKALRKLQSIADRFEELLEKGEIPAKHAMTRDILDYWLGKINPLQLMYVIEEATQYKLREKAEIYSKVRFFEYRICATIKAVYEYEQRKYLSKLKE